MRVAVKILRLVLVCCLIRAAPTIADDAPASNGEPNKRSSGLLAPGATSVN